MNTIIDLLPSSQWEIVATLGVAARPAQVYGVDDLPLSNPGRALLNGLYPAGIYGHQKAAIARFLANQDVCLTTATASGKSLLFYAAAVEQLSRNPEARILAIYPTRALGTEQVQRWQAALQQAGIPAAVERLDGSVRPIPAARLEVLAKARVLVCTPDIIHAWLLASLNYEPVQAFLRQVSLVIVDEVHHYTGVFGSHAAYLFRRLQNATTSLGAPPARYVCASATMAAAHTHLAQLFGLNFELIDPNQDTSPRHPLAISLVNPPPRQGMFEAVTELLHHLSSTSAHFVLFVDSRKQVELISAILGRLQANGTAGLDGLDILPYRSGYEEMDRAFIQERLAQGQLKGIIATSALELGIDVPYLDTCILVGVPSSATSLHQRMGRVGRHVAGQVICLNNGDVLDQAVFAHPPSLLDRPLGEGEFYLSNRPLQYIHALCLRVEHALLGGEGVPTTAGAIVWPTGICELLAEECAGQTPPDLKGLKVEAGISPHLFFPCGISGPNFGWRQIGVQNRCAWGDWLTVK